MTHVDTSAASATLSGRELALKRRQAMALHGKTGARTAPARAVRPAASTPASSSLGAPAHAASAASLTPPAAQVSPARARREALARAGKAALQKASATRPTGRVRPQREALQQTAATQPAGCGCGCGGTNPACQASLAPALDRVPATAQVAVAVAQPTGRALARARRAALAQDGKAGLKRVAQATRIATAMPGQDWQAAITKGATGRQIAMQRRLVQSLAGRTGVSNPAARPAGRMRARNVEAAVPQKVEEGHTLSGQTVTGTMTDRSRKVTGNEPGSCRPVTGTEYVGAEQFDTLCGTRPAPNPPKVGVGSTLSGERVTGTEVGRSVKVTGDEPGACRGITGTEYLSAERYAEFCANKPTPAPAKVGETQTHKGERLTGTLVGRSPKVTGDEHGADRHLTGTRYMGSAPDTAPDKVTVTHTAGGRPVTGTAVGHTVKITGDEPGACRGITGTEYLAAEQFSAVCGTTPPATPRKVSVMSSRDAETVTGTSVNRSDKVTGNEPGSCRPITGSQYYTESDFAPLCKSGGGAPRKVSVMPTQSGRLVSGTEVAPSPKLSGDESYGCKPVTGIDYVSHAQLAAVCDSTQLSAPVEPTEKVIVDQTFHGQTVTGALPARDPLVTGNEYGTCAPVSGTPYAGRGESASFCPAPDTEAQAARVRHMAVIPATVVTGDRPGAGGSKMTGDERGACEVISGTPYVGADNAPTTCATSGRFVSRARSFEVPSAAPAPRDFSIESPARYAQRVRGADVTGNSFAVERITGPVNKAIGLITGTPEFRHREHGMLRAEADEAIAAARRVTGEGRERTERTPITGDAWHAESRVTGTEGASSLARNSTLRGQPRGAGVNARAFREVERVEIPDSPITGSSGNTRRGATVTLSGGARG